MELMLLQPKQKLLHVFFIRDLLFYAIFSMSLKVQTFYHFYTYYQKLLNQLCGFLILKLLEFLLQLYQFPMIQQNASYLLSKQLHELIFYFYLNWNEQIILYLILLEQ